MQESCTYGSVRGAPSNGRPYRNLRGAPQYPFPTGADVGAWRRPAHIDASAARTHSMGAPLRLIVGGRGQLGGGGAPAAAAGRGSVASAISITSRKETHFSAISLLS
jgi:hypothetical protein